MYEARGKFYNYKGNKKELLHQHEGSLIKALSPTGFGVDELTNPNS